MNPRAFGVGAVILTLVGVLVGLSIFGGDRNTQAQPAPVVINGQASRPVSDIACGKTYEVDHLERFYIDGRVAVNFTFGGAHRNLQPQYIWNENVIGQSTEIRSARRVDRSLQWSLVTFLCQEDERLEGHKASNMWVMRYALTLRRPLRQQKVIRNGGPDRK